MSSMDKGNSNNFHPSISEDEREFYVKAYPTPEYVRDRKTHCTTCKIHIGTAPCNELDIKMHPILRVTHCTKCHDFYNSGEFSKGEDGSELYCRWCGQGGEVYCCSSCPFVFCKSCISKNLSRGVVADIEQNENWRCFACAPKILWPLRAVHWALMNYIQKQKKEIEAMNLNETEKRVEMSKDRSNCCRLAKAKCGNMSDSMDSIDSIASKRSHNSSNSSARKRQNITPVQQPATPASKRQKSSNDEVVCTPDLLSMLEPDCQITMSNKTSTRNNTTVTSSPKIFTVQQNFGQTSGRSAPPPLVLRNTSIQLRPVASTTTPIIRRTVVSPRAPSPAGSAGSQSPVYHTINGFRIDLNSAAQQGTYRLPNGKLIHVKRQSTTARDVPNNNQSVHYSGTMPSTQWQQPQIRSTATQGPQQHTNRPVQITPANPQQRNFVAIQRQSTPVQQQPQQQAMAYSAGVIGNTVISAVQNQNGPQIQMINGVNIAPSASQALSGAIAIRPALVRHFFPNTPIGQARSQLQDEVFSTMEICQHLTGKVQTLTNSNAYKQARTYQEVKELFIHLSYLFTYAIGRFKGLQDKCLADMRRLGFVSEANSLENGQLAAGVDYVRYGKLEDVELFSSSPNAFHNQIYEYRKSLRETLEDEHLTEPLSPPLFLNGINVMLENATADDEEWVKKQKDSYDQHSVRPKIEINDDDDDDVQEITFNDEPSKIYPDSYLDDDIQDDQPDGGDDENFMGFAEMHRSTEDVMRREEESHAYDRKLTRLIEQYPSIWCTRHPDYGNFEVTRKQWRFIASHFRRGEDIKMRWKNIRKRYVRIERRISAGKRFSGYFDKATNFLINRDTPLPEWKPVDCGTDDGDGYERKHLDAMEKELNENDKRKDMHVYGGGSFHATNSSAPVEIGLLDMKIIHFVKCNPVLWRKSSDPAFNKMDEQTRKSLWLHLWKSVPDVRCMDLVDRWTQLYEMYKTFRLKKIKSQAVLGSLELKYSKYLAKLSFLYKIDEEELKSEEDGLIFGDDLQDDDDEAEEYDQEKESKLQDMPDDAEFVRALIYTLRNYPHIWNPHHIDYYDIKMRDESWKTIAHALQQFQRDAKDVKRRWILAKFCYDRFKYEKRDLAPDSVLKRYCQHLPIDEMSFLNL